MVRATARAPADLSDRAPSVGSVLAGGLPAFLRDGLLPVLAFYGGVSAFGLAGGIALATAVSLLLLRIAARSGRETLTVRLGVAVVGVQALVGLVARSEEAFLTVPLLSTMAWAGAFLVSAAVGRPLAGALARCWYPFDDETYGSAEFRRAFAIESVVWGTYLAVRSVLRLVALGSGDPASFVVVMFVTGTPCSVLLMWWSVWFGVRRLA